MRSIAFATSRYAGNAYSEKAHKVIAKKLDDAPKMPVMKGQTTSVSGYRHAFVNVGIVANASLAMAKTIATFGSLVTYQRTNANPESAPQV